jgi:integrase/recombinase XerD
MRTPALSASVDQDRAVRTALGFRMQAERTLLYSFVRFVEAHSPTQPLRAHVAVAWACTAERRGQGGGAAQRLSMGRPFLLYLRAPVPDTDVPSAPLSATPRRRTPYLCTPEQIVTLREAARQVRPRRSLRPQTLSTRIGLLASTGLRLGEALRLGVRDVQLAGEPPRLHREQRKFSQSRGVPLHSPTAPPLRPYRPLRTRLLPASASTPFFLSATGQPVTHCSLVTWFSQLCRRLGFWPTAAHQRRPCLHSLRPTFAVQRILQWYEVGAEVYLLLPQLAVYVGHVRPQERYWYLTAPPELRGQAALRFQT